jgi:biopolymer transport protein ExbD
MYRIRKKTSLQEAEINLTPLIDVCFVVLIMFIVIAPLLEMERVELAAGPPLDAESVLAVQEKSPITIHVYSDNSFAVNKQRVTLAQLKQVLAYAQQKNPNARPQVFHDRNAKFGTYQVVKNAVEMAGFKEMDVILKPE